jgi:O-antigen ligase
VTLLERIFRFIRIDPWLFLVMISGTVLCTLTGRLVFLLAAPVFLVCRAGFRNITLIYYLLLVTIPFSAEVEVSTYLGTDFPDEPLMWLLTILLLFDFFMYPDKWKSMRIDARVASMLLLHLGWIIVSTILSAYPVLSLKFLAAKIWYIGAFAIGTWYCIRSKRDIYLAASLLMASMFISTCYVMFQHYRHGFSFETVNVSVEPLFRNHVNYGALLVCLLPLPIAGSILFPKYRYLLISLLVFWLTALFLTYSRGAWIAAFIGLASVLAMRVRMLNLLAIIFAAVLITGFSYLAKDNRYLDYRPNYEQTIFHQDFGEHMQATYRGTDLSTVERFHRWIAAFRMARGHLLHGYGPNSFYHEYRPYTVTAYRTYVSDNPEKSTVHNYFLLLLVEQGIPGLIIFCLFLLAILRVSDEWYSHTRQKAEKVLASAIIAIIAMIFSLNMLSDLIETDKIGSLFFICVGLLLKYSAGHDVSEA